MPHAERRRQTHTQRDGHLDDNVAPLVFQITRELRAAMERRLAAFDITAQQASLLVRSCRQPEVSPHELTPVLQTDNAGMTRLVDRLEARGLVARRDHPADRRSIVIGLTEAGRALAPRLAPIFGRVESDLLDGLSEDEVAQLKAMLCRLLDNLRAG